MLDELFGEFNLMIKEAEYIRRSGKIVNASLTAAPCQRATEDEKTATKEGKSASEI